MDDEVKTKAFIAVAIFLVGFFSAIAPLKVINVDECVFSAGNLMASGVLLSAGLVHQLPDSMELLESSHLSKFFPLAPFITGLTFCFFLILEEYLHIHFSQHPLVSGDGEGSVGSSKSGGSHDHNHNHINGHTNGNGNHDEEFGNHHHEHVHDHTEDIFHERDPLLTRRQTNNKPKTTHHHRGVSNNNSLTLSSCLYDVELLGTPLESFRSKTFGQEHHHHHDIDHLAEHVHGSLLASVILLCALSIHSLFEGLAIAISSNPSEVVSITTAVLAHKGFAGYALGSSMVAAEMNECHYWILVLVFSLCGVIGIVLGTIFEQLVVMQDPEAGESSVVGVIKSIVAGTFLYVSIVEIGLKEILICRDSKLLGNKLGQNEMQWTKLAAFLFGYLAMSWLSVFT